MKRRDFVSRTPLATAALAAGWSGRAIADAGFQKDGDAWTVRGSEAYTFESKSVGDTMAVGVWKPPPPPGPQVTPAPSGLQVVYVLDGSWMLGMAAAICYLQQVDLIKPGFPQLLLVGVDYPVGAANARSRDYTMADSVPAKIAKQFYASPKTAPGGADKFLSFLEDELDPWVRSNHDTKGKTAGILGDSFGGTFTFYSFMRQSPLFDRYWLGSPGILTTDTDYVSLFEQTLQSELVNHTRMYLSFGALEMNGGVDFYEDMGRNFNRTVSALRRTGNDGLEWKARTYPGHTHTTIMATALNDALLYLYGPHSP